VEKRRGGEGVADGTMALRRPDPHRRRSAQDGPDSALVAQAGGHERLAIVAFFVAGLLVAGGHLRLLAVLSKSGRGEHGAKDEGSESGLDLHGTLHRW